MTQDELKHWHNELAQVEEAFSNAIDRLNGSKDSNNQYRYDALCEVWQPISTAAARLKQLTENKNYAAGAK